MNIHQKIRKILINLQVDNIEKTLRPPTLVNFGDVKEELKNLKWECKVDTKNYVKIEKAICGCDCFECRVLDCNFKK